MGHVPAICRNCGLVFPSGIVMMAGMTVKDCTDQCPRCWTITPILNGYATIINDMVAFIVSPNHSLGDKTLLIATAKAVARGEVNSVAATQKLELSNKESGRLFREWATFGMTFVAVIASVASVVLSYWQASGNSPLDALAFDTFDRVAVEAAQPAPTPPESGYVRQTGPVLPTAAPERQGYVIQGTPRPDAPYENRKARRAAEKKSRSKGR